MQEATVLQYVSRRTEDTEVKQYAGRRTEGVEVKQYAQGTAGHTGPAGCAGDHRAQRASYA
jgi:hypothetical protein